MRSRVTPSHRFDPTDRVWWKGRAYRVVAKVKRHHTLQAEEPAGEPFIQITDDEITHEGDGFRHDPGYYSDAAVDMRKVHGSRSIDDMSLARLVRVHLRVRWAKAFHELKGADGKGGRPVVNRSHAGLMMAIEHLRGPIQDWYRVTFATAIEALRVREIAAVPSPSTLRTIVSIYQKAGMEGLRDRWARCGRRNQLHPDVRRILDREIPKFFSLTRPKPSAVIKRVHDAIEILNLGRDERLPFYSPRLIRARIGQMAPIFTRMSRHGTDAALTAFAPVGLGVGASRPGERLEMDDLEIDLFALLCSISERAALDPELLERVPRVRCTLTFAVDCGVSAVVGINLAPHAPDAATAAACLRSACQSKDRLAAWAGCNAEWKMTTRWEVVATDGGPPFRHETDERIREMTSGRKKPDQDPRMRGTVERLQGTFQADFLDFYSGRTHANSFLRGDYESAAMASLVFEDLYKAVVRWIVDVYHQSPHAALQNTTPAAAWRRFACDEEGIAPPLPSAEITRIFGMRRSATITPAGITLENLNYHSPEVAWLHANRADRQIQIRIDPEDLGSALLHVPLDVRERGIFKGREFISVPCLQVEARGLNLADWLWAQEATREQHRQDVEAGTPTRIAARTDLFEGGVRAMKEAGIPTHALTQSAFDKYMVAIDRKGVAALSPPSQRGPNLGQEQPLGGTIPPDQPGMVPFAAAGGKKRRRRKGADAPVVQSAPATAAARIKPLSPRYEDDEGDNKGEQR